MTDHRDGTDDDLLRRLVASADPARRTPPPDDLAAHLIRRTRERAMHEHETQHPTADRRRLRWLPLAAAAAVLVVGGTAYVATQSGDDGATPPTAGAPTVTELALPDSSPARCMQVTAQTVANAETALEATVTAVEDGAVVLDVDRWFVGGDADEIRLTAPAAEAPAIPIPGQPEFAVGERWLVTATDGRVNACGFTAPWSPRLAEVFDEAFAG